MRRGLAVGLGIGAIVAMLGCHAGSRPGETGTAESGVVSRTPGRTGTAGLFTFRLTPDGKYEKVDEFLVVEKSRGGPTQTIDLPNITRNSAPRIRGGQLLAHVPGRQIVLPLKHTDVKAQLTLHIGSVTVAQRYHNPYDSKIEAVYVFPLPDDAAVRDFVMQIGERRIRGIIREREEARRIYHEARHQGHVASLMTQERPNIFTQSVANIEPGKEIDIHITYFHTLRHAEGTYEFHFPMVVGPRFNPPGFREGVGAVAPGAGGASGQPAEVEYLPPGHVSAHDIALEVDVDAGVPIERLECPTHEVRIERPNTSRARVTLSPLDRIPNRDFVLRYRVGSKEIRGALATWKDESGGTFTLVLHPPETLADVPASPREMIFVLDCSGSMTGAPLEIAKRALDRCLRRLGPGDAFNIIWFSNAAFAMEPVPLPATPENVRSAAGFVDGLRAGGGTMMIEPVKVALGMPHTPGRFRIVSFMTDGYIGNDREIIAEVRRRLGPSRIFSFGVGSSVNRYLLEGMARAGRGVSIFLTLDESSERAADELYRRIEHPALADVRIDWGRLEAVDVHPSPPPDLFVGRPVVLTGRFKGSGPATIRVAGTIAGKPHEFAIEVNPDESGPRHPALPAVWARTKIATLHDFLAFTDYNTELGDEIKGLALRHGLLSDFTAFVAVDSSSRTAGQFGTTVVQPVRVPKGVQYETTVQEK